MHGTRFIIALFVCLNCFVTNTAADGPALVMKAKHEQKIWPYTTMPVAVVFMNKGESDITITDFLLSPRFLKVELRNDKHETIYNDVVDIPLASHREQKVSWTIKPGGSHGFEAFVKCKWIDRRATEPMFLSPGNYQIRFAFPIVVKQNDTVSVVRVKSEFADIEVIAPPAGELKEAFESVRQLSQPRNLLNDDWDYKKTIEQQQQWIDELTLFVKEHNDSPWSAYAYYSIACYYTRLGKKLQKDHKEEDAIPRFQQALDAARKSLALADKYEMQYLQHESLSPVRYLLNILNLGDSDEAKVIDDRFDEYEIHRARVMHGKL